MPFQRYLLILPLLGPPKASVEADFDIVNNKDDNDDTALNDAEAMKVVDEALTELPQFVVATAVFHLSHGSLIDAILDACRVPLKKQLAVKNVLELVGYQSNTKGECKLLQHKPFLEGRILTLLQRLGIRSTENFSDWTSWVL